MYLAEQFRAVLSSRGRGPADLPKVSRNVVLLGLVSLLTDVSSEMVAVVLPVYLVVSAGLSPAVYGAIDGVYQGASAPARLLGGLAADRWRRHKEVAGLGYGLSALCKLGLLAAGRSAGAVVAVIFVDRLGKGIRTAPRDALISLSSPPDALGRAFGVHRAMDTAGAVLGPLLAYGLLSLAPGEYGPLFVVSFCFAVIGLAVLGLFVENQPAAVVAAAPPSTAPLKAASLRSALGLLRDRSFAWLVVVAGVLGLVTVSDAFLYLSFQSRLDFNVRYFPLLYVGTALAYMSLAVPLGRLADRVGRLPVFLAGHVLLLVVYTSLLTRNAGAGGFVAGYLLLLGAYYASTDGVLMALAGGVLPPGLQASGMALLTAANGAARFLSSVVFGAVWAAYGLHMAGLVFGAGLVAALLLALWGWRRFGGERPREGVLA